MFFLCVVFVQDLEEGLREAQSAAHRMETQLEQKERLFEDKIKVQTSTGRHGDSRDVGR